MAHTTYSATYFSHTKWGGTSRPITYSLFYGILLLEKNKHVIVFLHFIVSWWPCRQILFFCIACSDCPPLECKLHGNRDFCLLCSGIEPQRIEQWQVYSGHSLNMTERHDERYCTSLLAPWTHGWEPIFGIYLGPIHNLCMQFEFHSVLCPKHSK